MGLSKSGVARRTLHVTRDEIFLPLFQNITTIFTRSALKSESSHARKYSGQEIDLFRFANDLKVVAVSTSNTLQIRNAITHRARSIIRKLCFFVFMQKVFRFFVFRRRKMRNQAFCGFLMDLEDKDDYVFFLQTLAIKFKLNEKKVIKHIVVLRLMIAIILFNARSQMHCVHMAK